MLADNEILQPIRENVVIHGVNGSTMIQSYQKREAPVVLSSLFFKVAQHLLFKKTVCVLVQYLLHVKSVVHISDMQSCEETATTVAPLLMDADSDLSDRQFIHIKLHELRKNPIRSVGEAKEDIPSQCVQEPVE